MKRYVLSWAAAQVHKPEYPERTARRNTARGAMDFDVAFQVWPNRASMLTTIHMQERADTHNRWRPVIREYSDEVYSLEGQR